MNLTASSFQTQMAIFSKFYKENNNKNLATAFKMATLLNSFYFRMSNYENYQVQLENVKIMCR